MSIWEEVSEARSILSNARKSLNMELVKTLNFLAANLKQARSEINQDTKNIKIYRVEEKLLKISALLTKSNS